MDIRCRKTTCLYNDRYTCKARDILMKKNCECEKFEKSDKPVSDKTKWMFTANPPKYAPQRDSKTLHIKCRANCLFNKNGYCEANGITLNDLKRKPLCVTFLHK